MSGEVVPFRGSSVPSAPAEYYPPQSVETEAGLLGAILTATDAFGVVSPILEEHHFYSEVHRHVYRAMAAVARAGQPVTFSLVRAALGPDWLEGEIAPGSYRGREYLAHLVVDVTVISGVAESAKLIRDYWALREFNRIASQPMTRQGYVAPTVLGSMLDEMDQVRASLMDRENRSSTTGQAVVRVLDRIERAYDGEVPDYPSTGIFRLDDTLGGGLQAATVVTLGGRTSMGKSVLGVEVADRAAEARFGVVYHSLEMPAEAIGARQVSSRLERKGVRIPFREILRHKGVTLDQARLVREVAGEVADLPLRIEDGGGKTIAEISATSERRCNEFARRNIKPGLIVIDHAHLVKFGKRHNREDEGLREVTQGVVALAKRLDCAVLLLAQLNRKTEDAGREDKRPTLADIRGGGSFEEDSDTVLFVYRPGYYLQRTAEYRAGDPGAVSEFEIAKHKLELIVDKNRQGAPNVVHQLWIDEKLNAVRNLSDRGA